MSELQIFNQLCMVKMLIVYICSVGELYIFLSVACTWTSLFICH